ncbi:hypothetical protein ACIA8C_07160 [Nocardia sp. NPDC051321]|uniref:hypothetical protein n=1 Tax=Nocardia sp. NPDC051321 TaxID=3364323 RepID=UPI00379F168A
MSHSYKVTGSFVTSNELPKPSRILPMSRDKAPFFQISVTHILVAESFTENVNKFSSSFFVELKRLTTLPERRTVLGTEGDR